MTFFVTNVTFFPLVRDESFTVRLCGRSWSSSRPVRRGGTRGSVSSSLLSFGAVACCRSRPGAGLRWAIVGRSAPGTLGYQVPARLLPARRRRATGASRRSESAGTGDPSQWEPAIRVSGNRRSESALRELLRRSASGRAPAPPRAGAGAGRASLRCGAAACARGRRGSVRWMRLDAPGPAHYPSRGVTTGRVPPPPTEFGAVAVPGDHAVPGARGRRFRALA